MEIVIGISAVVGVLALSKWESDRLEDIQLQSDEHTASSLLEE